MTFQFGVERGGIKRHADHVLVVSIFFLTLMGIVALYTASIGFAERFFGNSLYLFTRQLIFAGIGLAFFFIASFIRLETLRAWIGPMVIGTLVLCLLTFVPGIGISKNGASRWIGFGPLTLQPSELVKLVLPLYLAHIFDKKKDRIVELSGGVMPPALVSLAFVLLIIGQNNFSTALFIAFNALVVFFLAGVRLTHFFSAVALLLPFSALFILTKEHRLRRFISLIWPDWEPFGAGYQVRASVMTIASGFFMGKGLGQGTRKIASVPEIHSDFIFSAFAEETGFIGVMVFFFVLVLFAVRGYRAALHSEDLFRRLLASGLVTIIVTQSLLNVAVVAGAVPTTGIPLPFFSAGGSSLAITMASAGLLVNVSRANQTGEFNYVR